MHYLLTPLHKHFDLGFGEVANSFKRAADAVSLPAPDSPPPLNIHLPANFLYRHAIELYLKSTIVIFHKKFKLPYGALPYDAEPHVLVASKWKPMYKEHGIAPLYIYVRQLFAAHDDYLHKKTNTNWTFPPELDGWISEIDATDASSTFFRYPVTKHQQRDKAKSVMREDTYANIVSRMGPGQPSQKAFVVLNEADEIIQSFYRDDTTMKEAAEILRAASNLFYGMHAALRSELTGGW